MKVYLLRLKKLIFKYSGVSILWIYSRFSEWGIPYRWAGRTAHSNFEGGSCWAPRNDYKWSGTRKSSLKLSHLIWKLTVFFLNTHLYTSSDAIFGNSEVSKHTIKNGKEIYKGTAIIYTLFKRFIFQLNAS